MLQSPRNFFTLAAFATTITVAIIAVGLAGSLCNYSSWNYCAVQGTVAAGPATGIVAAVFAGVFSGLGICWLILVPLWNFQPTKIILLSGFSFVVLFSFISAVILAWTANNVNVGASYGTCGAASAFEFFLMFGSIACILFVIVASGGLSNLKPTNTQTTSTSSSTSSTVPSV